MNQGTQGVQEPPRKRELRPFPAIDPEPDHRYSWRTLLRAGIALVAACAVAAGVFFGVRLVRSPAPSHAATAAAPFSDGDGMIVFEQQPSGLLGTARPDGSHSVLDSKLGGLQGTDLAVASPDGRYLVNSEAQLVTLGAHGPVSITQVPPPDAQAATQTSGNATGLEWMSPTFADGGRYLAVTECDPIGVAGFGGNEAWAGWLIPIGALAGGGPTAKPQSFSLVTATAGDPGADALLAAEPANPAAARQQVSCDGAPQPDSVIGLLSPGKPPQVIVTAVALLRAAGWKPGTPVEFDVAPAPDGSQFIATMFSDVPSPTTAQPGGRFPVIQSASFLVSRTGKVLAALPQRPGLGVLAWSPGGRQLATCAAALGRPSTVFVLTIQPGGARPLSARAITLPGRHDAGCNQLLWSPDGSQLIYSALVTERGLTSSDDLQRGWTVIDLRTGAVHDVTAPGQPAAWLPA